MANPTSVLRVPADPAYIIVAKRAAAAFGSIAGFDVEAVDDLTIAVAQACHNAIDAVGGGEGQIRLTFKLAGGRLEVNVHSFCARGDVQLPQRVTVAPYPCEAQADFQASAQADIQARADAEARQEVAAATELALRLVGLFVDDYRYRVDERTGGLRVRLTKYRVS